MAVSEGIMKTKDDSGKRWWEGGRAGRKGVERGELGQQFTVLTDIRGRHWYRVTFKPCYSHTNHCDPNDIICATS
jgi:hypothetical protein